MTGVVLVATGTKREGAVLRDPGFLVIPGGGDAPALRETLEAAVRGATGVLSFGMAGALADDLRIGDWVVADRVTGAVDATCDPAWSERLRASLPAARGGAVYADGRLIATVTEKRGLFRNRGALAADMESHVAAAVAADHGLPLAVARCISDEAARELPPAIALAMRPDGSVDAPAMLRSLLGRPSQVPEFARTIAGFMHAMRALQGGAVALRA